MFIDKGRWPISGIFEDDRGRILFYPMVGRGRLLPGMEAADALEKALHLSAILLACATAVMICGVLVTFAPSLVWIMLWPALLGTIVCQHLFGLWLIRNLPTTDDPRRLMRLKRAA
jgi:hypothetical protein